MNIYKFSLYLFFTLVALSSCLKEQTFITSSDAKLSFSTDTLVLDTSFTEIGTATYSFKVYNKHDEAIRIQKIYLENGEASFFRVNVNGDYSDLVEDAEIWPNDSIYVFVEVTIDPDQPEEVSPFVVEENLFFETNGNVQSVLLQAWGQNAVYLPSKYNKGVPAIYSCDNGEWVWDDPRPYVIYGEVFIDDCLLRIPEGAQVYIHGGVARNELSNFEAFNDGFLRFLDGGSLNIEGTLDNPVTIEGDRLEDDFKEEEGQWYGIIFDKGSQGNSINYLDLKNSIFGIFVDSTSTLSINNSRIHNTTGSAMIGFASTINATNCLFYNNNSTALNLALGGHYRFDHCTFTSYGVNASSVSLGNAFCYTYDEAGNCVDLKVNSLFARFRNCIMAGSRGDQLSLSDYYERQSIFDFNVQFQNCAIRVDDLLTYNENFYGDFFESMCTDCIHLQGDEALFLDESENDYHLDSLSVAIDQGLLINEIPLDLDGVSRVNMPDLGCFEYIE